MKLRILLDAEVEIESARQWLNQQSSELGSRFLDDLRTTFAEILDHPLSFPHLETFPDDGPYRRSLLHTFRYAVIYEVLDDEILVVPHTSREPNYWLDRD